MQTKVLKQGQVALPLSVRRKLRLRPGDLIEVTVRDGQIVLTPRACRGKSIILVDPITGLPVLSAGPDAPVLTSEEVNEILFGKL
jgi:AbrB family looped-hinge helix DNA binding protein